MEEHVGWFIYSRYRYAMKWHDASRSHCDLRLQFGNALLSWAIIPGPSCCPDEVRDAVEMDDHRIEYITFEGVHDTGMVMLWDQGGWEPHPDYADVASSLAEGLLRLTLYGEKLGGSWTLTRTTRESSDGRPIWEFRKEADKFARKATDQCILKEKPNSVAKGKRSRKRIAREWKKGKPRHVGQRRLFEMSKQTPTN